MDCRSLGCPERALFVLTLFMVGMVLTCTKVDAACSSNSDLINACLSYVVGSNPPAPPYSSTCCSLLRSNGASCICSKLPSNAASLVAASTVNNIRSSCQLSYNCPGL
ncbi:hypothetical protein KP509_1Z051100 [Ceratopteris richardii]|nr:hypothetical protein KP509_1Z051100 [Ceratopteris richardii]